MTAAVVRSSSSRLAVRSIRRAMSTTPGKLRARSAVSVAGIVVLWAISLAAVLTAGHVIDGIGLTTVPAMIDAQRIHATLADADREAADAFLTGGTGTAERRYQSDVTAASDELERAAEHNGDGAPAARQLASIIALVAEYQGLVQTARTDNRQDFPVGAAYLRRASTLMHEPGDGILARVDSLDRMNSADLAVEDSSLWLVVVTVTASGLVTAALLALLVSLQAFIKRRFKRRWNARLLGSTALLGFLGCWLALQSVVSYEGLAMAERQAFPRLYAMWQMRSLVADASGNEWLSLVARGNGAAFDSAFNKETSEIVAGRLSQDSVRLARLGRVSFGGMLAAEIRAADFPGERDATVAVLAAYEVFLDADAAVRAKAATGDYDGAVALALDARGGHLEAAFSDLAGSLDAVIGLLQRRFDDAIGRSRPGPALLLAISFLSGSAVWLVVGGVRPRIAEYTA